MFKRMTPRWRGGTIDEFKVNKVNVALIKNLVMAKTQNYYFSCG